MILAGLVAGASPCVFAEELAERPTDPRVEEIVSTGIYEKSLAQLPRSANVITAADIAQQPSTNLVDLLAREANLNLRSTLGNAKFSGVDIRGQGDTYTSNVLVLVDGVQLNAADLSGADYSSIPLSRIERIEVIRGANTVRYGTGAVGGVINIITREPEAGAVFDAQAGAGSYAARNGAAGAMFGGDVLFAGLNAAFSDTDGFRDNSALNTEDYTVSLGVKPAVWFDLRGRIDWHTDEYGLPGGISPDADPTSTNTPFDGGETDDRRSRLDLTLGDGAVGRLWLGFNTRDRENEFRFGLSPGATPDRITEDNQRLQLRYDLPLQLFGRRHAVTAGLDLMDTDYAREGFNGTPGLAAIERGEIEQRAWFAAVDVQLTDTVSLTGGYRRDRFELDNGFVLGCAESDKFGSQCLPGVPRFPERDPNASPNVWNNSSAEVGLVYSPTASTNLFVSAATSFRNPNVDELVLSSEDLGPQRGKHIDAGIRQRFGSAVEWSFSVFLNRTDDEILFGLDPSTNTPENRNADESTRRVGGETDIRWYALPSLTFTANAGYTQAKFTGSNTYVPLVPEWTGALGVQWQPTYQWNLAVIQNYVGERYDGNDFNNSSFPKLDAYQVTDAKLSYEWAGMTFFAGVSNLFDERYSASGFSGTAFPMPDRNFYAGVTAAMNMNNP